MKPDPPGPGRRPGIHEFLDCLDHDQDLIVVVSEFPFELGEFPGKFLVTGDDFPKLDEYPDHKDAHLDGPVRVQDARGHDRAVLGEYPGIYR